MIIVFLFTCYLFPSFGQQNIPSFIQKGLVPYNSKKFSNIKKGFSLNDVTFYNLEGKVMDKMEVVSQIQSKTNTLMMYVDSLDEIKAVVFRPKTEEELKIEKRDSSIKNAEKYISKPSESFKVRMLKGDSLSFNPKNNHNIYVLNFWFTACAPCVVEMPELNKLYDKYKDQGVKFLAITYDDEEEITKFLSKKMFKYPIAVEAESVIKKYNISSFPTNMIIDKNGLIIFEENGLKSGISERLDQAITKAMK